MADVHPCRCADLPDTWSKCGKTTQKVWSPGCDRRSLESATKHLDMSLTELIEWISTLPPGRPD